MWSEGSIADFCGRKASVTACVAGYAVKMRGYRGGGSRKSSRRGAEARSLFGVWGGAPDRKSLRLRVSVG